MYTAKLIFVIFILLLVFQNSNAQVDSVYTGENSYGKKHKPRQQSEKLQAFKERLSYGGMVMPGYSMSNYGNVFYVVANPNIGYKVNDDLTIGVEANYSYTSLKSKYGSYTQSIYGPGAFARYKVTRSLFLQVQYDKLNQPDYYASISKRIWVDYLYAGGGYFQKLGQNSAVVYSILYNLTPTKNSVYFNPLIQIGVVVGL